GSGGVGEGERRGLGQLGGEGDKILVQGEVALQARAVLGGEGREGVAGRGWAGGGEHGWTLEGQSTASVWVMQGVLYGTRESPRMSGAEAWVDGAGVWEAPTSQSRSRWHGRSRGHPRMKTLTPRDRFRS